MRMHVPPRVSYRLPITKAPVRRDGDNFQARIFWRKAVCLLDPNSPVIRVGFESGPKGFDDVWVEYDPSRAPNDPEGKPILREYTQCKWHVSVSDFGHSDLIDPEWINANRFSFLQRARNAQHAHAKDGIGVRFKLLTNWRIAQTDPLRPLIHQRHKAIRLEQLFGTKTDASATGRIRKLWREHLGIDDAELRLLARTLSLDTDSTSLDDLRELLDMHFENRGLLRIPLNESSFRYDDIVFQWLAQGRLEFTRDTFRDACQRENLFAKRNSPRTLVGVKSFEHAFDRLEERCSTVLDLIPYFNDRAIRDQQDWTGNLYPALKRFLIDAAREPQPLLLALDAHLTLAFAAGSVVNIKSGRHVEIEHRTIDRQSWSATDTFTNPDWPTWNFEVEDLTSELGEMAVAVALTHDIPDAVRGYIATALPGVSKLLVAKPSCGSGAQSVASGRHAFELAEALVQRINMERKDVKPPMHIFIAAPNAFTFFLGQRQPGMGRTTLYEYDFEGAFGGGYQASLTLPT